MSLPRAFTAARLFDGTRMHDGHALVVADGQVASILPAADLDAGLPVENIGDGVLAPGFVDLQVNGGGGVMLNDAPCSATLERIAAAHVRLGATSILPTLITDRAEATIAAIEAVEDAVRRRVPGIIGLHLEGPHIAQSRKGAHDPDLIRPMARKDRDLLLDAARRLPVLMVTLAPEVVDPEDIAALARAGVVVSLGHSEADLETCRRAVRAGARCVTHLFNAMSQLGSREPGLVGAALDEGGLSAGLIADGVHVHPASMRAALAAKAGPGRLFLVSDAMATAGSTIASFTLNGREICRTAGRLTLSDGTLAGADLALADAVRRVTSLGVPLETTLAMASSVPAGIVGLGGRIGALARGRPADFVHLDGEGRLAGVWRSGERVAGITGGQVAN